MYPWSLKLLNHSLKVTLQDGDQTGFRFSVSLSCALSTVQKAVPRVRQESESLIGGLKVG